MKDLKNNILDQLDSEINNLKNREISKKIIDKKIKFKSNLQILLDNYDYEINNIKSQLDTQTIINRQYQSVVSNRSLIIDEEINDKHLNLSIVLTMLDNLLIFIKEHPKNYKITQLINDIDIIKTYLVINLTTEVTRRKEVEYFNSGLQSSIDNLTNIFNWLDIDISLLTNWTKRFFYGEKTLYKQYPNMQLKHLKNINDKGIVSGSFNELFRRSESLVFAEIELRSADEISNYNKNIEYYKEKKLPPEDIPLLSTCIMIKDIETKFRELELTQDEAINFLK